MLALILSQRISGSLHELGHLLAHLGWVAHDMNASGLESSDLLSSSTLTTSNDGTGVAHTAAWGRGLASDEADNGQVAVVVRTKPLSGFLLGLTTDLTNHDDTFGFGIIDELSEHINEVSTVERVTANTDNRRLAKSLGSRLVNSLVGQSTRAGHDTDFTLRVDVTRHDTDLAFARLDDTGTVRANQARLVLRLHDRFDLDHIESGNTLSDADNEIHLCLNSFEDSISGEGRRNINDGSLSTGSRLCV